MLGLILQSISPSAPVWAYPLRTIIVGAILIYYRKDYFELKPRWNGSAAILGILVFGLWVGLDPYLPKISAPISEWNPSVLRSQTETGYWAWVFFRVLGSSIVVAYAEELFWRGFLLRWIIDPDFKKVPLGTFSWPSFLITTVFFGVEHYELVSGMITGGIYAGLLYWRKNLFLCVLAHGITNFLLALYVLRTESWNFW